MWKPDGRGSKGRIAVLTPHLDPVPESEFSAMAPPGVSIHTARVPLGMIGPDGEITASIGPEVARAFSEPPHVDNAVSSLVALEPGAIIYAFTSSSYILGANADQRLKERLEGRALGVPVVVQTQALATAASVLGGKNIALVHPPWYTAELDLLGAKYFEALGIRVLRHGSADLRDTYGEIDPEQIFSWVKQEAPDEADLIVIGGGGFRAIGVIEALEVELSRPVITANQAAFWLALGKLGIEIPIDGYGQLFEFAPPT
jgi:maleate isomerase